jgi:hypothetical protein
MRIRTTLILTAIVSSILGAVVVYLVLSVPNDLRADALLKQARKDLTAGQTAAAATSLKKIVQQYPRTDAAAAATVALVSIADSEHQKLRRELEAARTAQEKAIAELQKSVTELRNRPEPKPQIIVQEPPKPAPKPAVKKAPAKKPSTRKRR